jgi:hypothetical protein
LGTFLSGREAPMRSEQHDFYEDDEPVAKIASFSRLAKRV